jgi:hypothetical protein
MLRRIRKLRFAMLLMLVGASFFVAGQALAWQFDQPFSSGLYPAKSWAPDSGRLQGSGGIDSQGKRATQPLANNVQWRQAAIDWMRANYQGNPAFVFHSSSAGNPGSSDCSNWWKAVSWASTNLPGSSASVVSRSCGYTFANELRIFGNQYQMSAGTNYFGQSWYQDTNTSSDPKGVFSIDTSWYSYGSTSDNFNKNYCIPASSNTAGPR